MHLLRPLSLLALLAAATTAQNTTTKIRYMPFGDSITEIICWRALLWDKLQTTPYAARVDFVGSGRTENNCANARYDRDNEGHSGFLAIDIADKGQLDGWLTKNPADVITMHLGTNDIVQRNKEVKDILAAFTKLVATMRAKNPRVKIVVAQIIPLSPSISSSAAQKISALNAAIPAWAAPLNSTASPLWVVDQWTGFSASADLRDGVHPNASGDRKMLDKWWPAVLGALAAVERDAVAGKAWSA